MNEHLPIRVYVDACPGRNCAGLGVFMDVNLTTVEFATGVRGHYTTTTAEAYALLMGIDVVKTMLEGYLALTNKARIPGVIFMSDSETLVRKVAGVESRGPPKNERLARVVRAALDDLKRGLMIAVSVEFTKSEHNPADALASRGLAKWKERWR